MTEVKVNCSASSAPQLQSLSFHTRVCSLGKVELLSCWLDCLGLAHLKETARKITVKKKLLESFCQLGRRQYGDNWTQQYPLFLIGNFDHTSSFDSGNQILALTVYLVLDCVLRGTFFFYPEMGDDDQVYLYPRDKSPHGRQSFLTKKSCCWELS